MAFLFRRHRHPKEPEPASAPQPSKQQGTCITCEAGYHTVSHMRQVTYAAIQTSSHTDDDLVPPPPLTAATTAASIEGSEKLPEREQPPMPAATGDERVPVTDDNEAVEALDLCFAVDCTGSMASYIAAAQRNIIAIVEGIARTERVGVRFGLVCYRDHPPQEATYVTRVFQFTADVAEMKVSPHGRGCISACQIPIASPPTHPTHRRTSTRWQPSAAATGPRPWRTRSTRCYGWSFVPMPRKSASSSPTPHRTAWARPATASRRVRAHIPFPCIDC